MRVLWCCNVLLPEIADAAGISEKAHSAGWIEGFLQEIKNQSNVELGIICPYNTKKRDRLMVCDIGFAALMATRMYWMCFLPIFCMYMEQKMNSPIS